MKVTSTLFLVFAVIAGCSSDSSGDGAAVMTDADKLISTHADLERAMLDYYRSIEKDVTSDLGVSREEVVDRVQSLIDEGYVEKPAILILTEKGPVWERVDYATYKKFMTDHAIASRRYHGVQPHAGDTVAMDSIRNSLLKALNGDSRP